MRVFFSMVERSANASLLLKKERVFVKKRGSLTPILLLLQHIQNCPSI